MILNILWKEECQHLQIKEGGNEREQSDIPRSMAYGSEEPFLKTPISFLTRSLASKTSIRRTP